jgi:hypothetical protein
MPGSAAGTGETVPSRGATMRAKASAVSRGDFLFHEAARFIVGREPNLLMAGMELGGTTRA